MLKDLRKMILEGLREEEIGPEEDTDREIFNQITKAEKAQTLKNLRPVISWLYDGDLDHFLDDLESLNQ